MGKIFGFYHFYNGVSYRNLSVLGDIFWGFELTDMFGCLLYYINLYYIYIHILVGGLEHQFDFPINIGLLIIPIDFHIFQRGYIYIYCFSVLFMSSSFVSTIF